MCNLEEKIKELKNSPIYAMSLASKELFHSNFWAWLIEQDINFAGVFFSDFSIKNDEQYEVKREKDNMDITIRIERKTEEKIYIIENKFKSIPDEKQLKKYQEKVHDDFVKGCLAYFIEPYFDKPNGWEHISYEEILNRISEFTKTSKKETIRKNSVFIEMYCKDFKNLIYIINNTKEKNTSLCCTDENLKELKMHDIYSKLKVAKLKQLLCKEINKDELGNFKFECYPDYSNGASLSLRYFKLSDDKKSRQIEIGIQMQADKFCHYIYLYEKGRTLYNHQTDIFNECAKELESWFDKNYSSKNGEKINGEVIKLKNNKKINLLDIEYSTNMKPKASHSFNFNSFKAPGGDIDGVFIYQYYNFSKAITDKNCLVHKLNEALSYIEKQNLTDKLEKIYKKFKK